ncbi:uncharacterized protein LOC120089132 [Benincasa hispida]|uniref:uncharacterized protein LOC120089132 n=1 Tax=Benincasa hispida TaxID=102211 RepID=UPI00190099D9|nr:uncharacterized protein LOC120089132 [Benincasa hispida]
MHLMEFACNNSYQTVIGTLPFDALYGKSCKSPVCWGEVGERKLLSPELVQTMNEAIHKIRARMQTAQSRQKSYADVGRKDLEFEIDDKMFLRVAPIKGIMRFGRKGKLSSRYVTDPSHVVDFEPLQLNNNLSYEEKPIEILAKEVKTLRRREISFVKVLQQNHQFKEATLEQEDEMKIQYPELFQE